MIRPIAWYHERHIHERRVRVLAHHFADLIAPNADVLDVGCGDGKLAARIQRARPDISVRGIDIFVRDSTAIPVIEFDGTTIPMESDSVDTVTMVDVLHHADDASRLLREAKRVAGKQIIIKDHFVQGFAAWKTLRFMDQVGNARHGVSIPCNYLTPIEWQDLFDTVGLNKVHGRERLGLYMPPLSWLFERSLHFVATLEPPA